jgi:hypothetical protein
MSLETSRTWAAAPARYRSLPKSRFCRRTNHINGVFAADIMRFLRILAATREIRAKPALSRCLLDVFA